jgi:hypothetical protein
VRERATLQGIPFLAADLVLNLLETTARGLPLALVDELHGLADSDDRWIRDRRIQVVTATPFDLGPSRAPASGR